jgi:protein tyrosine/serine phosphatase
VAKVASLIRTRLALTTLAVGAVAAASLLTLRLMAPGLLGANFYPVLEGRVYRSGQLTPSELEAYATRFSIASVVNLQGKSTSAEWYEAELAVARRRGLRHYDLDFSARRLPTRPNVTALIELIETLPQPLLLHCGAGADRAGLASAVARIVLAKATSEEARSELALEYGHLPFGPQSELRRFFDLYETYLDESGERDSSDTFKRWVTTEYVPYGYSARIDVVRRPDRATPQAPVRVRVRITNTSPESWQLSRSKAEGVKLGLRVRRSGDDDWRDFDRAGYLAGSVEPGATLELEHQFLAPAAPGRYELKLDLVDEHVTWFEDQGSTPAVVPLEVADRIW